jgi:hypothetical protein
VSFSVCEKSGNTPGPSGGGGPGFSISRGLARVQALQVAVTGEIEYTKRTRLAMSS